MVKYIESKTEFDAELKTAGNKLVVIDFTASWCGPCRNISPVFEKLAEENKNVVFLKVDVDAAADLSGQLGISCMPTFYFYKNGVKIREITGASVQKLTSAVQELQ